MTTWYTFNIHLIQTKLRYTCTVVEESILDRTNGKVRVFSSAQSEQRVFVRPLIGFVSLWYTFGSGTRLEVGSNTSPKLTVLPPSSEELSAKSTATVLCLANGGFPSDWTLRWKVDGSGRTGLATRSVPGKDGLYSWSSTLTLTSQEWTKGVSVICEATQGSQAAVTKVIKGGECS
ncbi:hypothetical protein ACEWY4_001927 [Coilia grayii]|uniref:Ig-like domain-containing protein n=1 Tax=Coilia grayii TaxID=363190 RepID=A0ABD1KUB2_9TELE